MKSKLEIITKCVLPLAAATCVVGPARAQGEIPSPDECAQQADSKRLTGAAKASYIRVCSSRPRPAPRPPAPAPSNDGPVPMAEDAGADRSPGNANADLPEALKTISAQFAVVKQIEFKPQFGPARLPIDIEALAQGQQAVAKSVSKCGEQFVTARLYYGKIEHITEVKNPVAIVGPSRRPTEADRLNGIEWIGTADLFCTSNRQYRLETKSWDKWEDCYGSSVPYSTVAIVKQNGRWSAKTDEGSSTAAVSCRRIQ